MMPRLLSRVARCDWTNNEGIKSINSPESQFHKYHYRKDQNQSYSNSLKVFHKLGLCIHIDPIQKDIFGKRRKNIRVKSRTPNTHSKYLRFKKIIQIYRLTKHSTRQIK